VTRVDFYVLAGEDPADRLVFVCRLAEKAYESSRAVFVHGDDERLLARLDDALWTFRPSGFVPHRHVPLDEPPNAIDADPVQISSGEPGPDRRILINLGERVPPFFSRFERALEVVDQAPATREAGRERYRFYSHRGYPLKHHRL